MERIACFITLTASSLSELGDDLPNTYLRGNKRAREVHWAEAVHEWRLVECKMPRLVLGTNQLGLWQESGLRVQSQAASPSSLPSPISVQLEDLQDRASHG